MLPILRINYDWLITYTKRYDFLLLISLLIPPTHPITQENYTALHFAAENGWLDIVMFLLEECGMTAIHVKNLVRSCCLWGGKEMNFSLSPIYSMVVRRSIWHVFMRIRRLVNKWM
jgi:hypothetical protein